MSGAPPPPSSGASSSSSNAYAAAANLQQARASAAAAAAASQHAHHQTTASSIYSFSVHQPYTNWPLHASSSHYPSSWYPVHPQAYGQTKSYRDGQVQTSDEHLAKSKLSTDAANQLEEEEKEEPETTKEEEDAPKQAFRPHWDAVLRAFLKNAGLWQALRGFADDMVMMNEEWEREVVPGLLRAFVKELTELLDEGTVAIQPPTSQPNKTLDERKLEYVKPASGIEPQTPTSLTRSIARFLAQSRHRNDASNRAEFLQSIAEKRRRLELDVGAPAEGEEGVGESGVSGEVSAGAGASADVQMSSDSTTTPSDTNANADPNAIIPSCARADAKPQDRDVQMKYDIAKNEDGPLKRTMRGRGQEAGTASAAGAAVGGRSADVNVNASGSGSVTAERHPGMAGRLETLEGHLAVRYVPSPPQSLMDRIRFLEDHVVKLERDYPPWAALHFNQPNRGWPPPPRVTPIIVPSHLTSSSAPSSSSSLSQSTHAHTPSRKHTSKSHLDSPFTSTPFTPKPSSSGAGAGGTTTGTGTGTSTTTSTGTGTSTGKGRAKSSLHRAVMEKLEVQRAMGDLGMGMSVPSGVAGFQFQMGQSGQSGQSGQGGGAG